MMMTELGQVLILMYLARGYSRLSIRGKPSNTAKLFSFHSIERINPYIHIIILS